MCAFPFSRRRYGAGESEADALAFLRSWFGPLQDWAASYLQLTGADPAGGAAGSASGAGGGAGGGGGTVPWGNNERRRIQIRDVLDIEESIWSPMYGLKGRQLRRPLLWPLRTAFFTPTFRPAHFQASWMSVSKPTSSPKSSRPGARLITVPLLLACPHPISPASTTTSKVVTERRVAGRRGVPERGSRWSSRPARERTSHIVPRYGLLCLCFLYFEQKRSDDLGARRSNLN